MSINTVKSWMHRPKFKKFNQESTDDQINDEVELIERNRETKNRSETERLRAVKIEIVNKHKENIDKDVKEEIKNLGRVLKKFIPEF